MEVVIPHPCQRPESLWLRLPLPAAALLPLPAAFGLHVHPDADHHRLDSHHPSKITKIIRID